MLEYIYAVFFKNSFKWPKNLVCTTNVTNKKGLEGNIAEQILSLKNKIKDMQNLFDSIASDHKILETDYPLIKIIVQKKLFQFGDESHNFYLGKIKMLTKNYWK